MNLRNIAQYAGDVTERNYQIEQEYLDRLRREVEEQEKIKAPTKQVEPGQNTSEPLVPQQNPGFIQGGLAALNPNYAKEHGWKSVKRKEQKKDEGIKRPMNYIFNAFSKLFNKFASASDPSFPAEGAYNAENKQKDLFSDIYTTVMTNKNETQIETSLGKMSMADQMQNYLNPDSMLDYINTAKQLIATGDRLNALIDRYLTTGITEQESAEMDSLRKQYNELNSKKNSYEQMFDIAKQYEAYNSVTGAFADIQAPLADLDLDFGTGLGNSLRGFNENLTNMQRAIAQMDDSKMYQYYNNLKNVYKNFSDRSNLMRSKWRQDIDADRKDLEKYRGYQVSDYFKSKEQAVQELSLFNPERWLYQVPGLIGSSMSAPQKQAASMITGLAAGYLTGGSSVVSKFANKALVGATYGLNLSAGSDENAANVAQATKQILAADLKAKGQEKEFLEDGRRQLNNPNATVDDIYLAYCTGEYVPKNYKIRQTILDASSGSLKQFMQGQGVNTVDATFDTALEVIPFGKLAQSSMLSSTKSSLNTLADDVIRIPIKSSKGGQKIINAVQKVGKYKNNLTTKAVKKLAEKGLDRSKNVADYAKALGRRILVGKEDASIIEKAIRSYAKRSAVGAYSEAVEEGLQQEQQYERAVDRDDNYFNAADQFVNTVLSGPRLWWFYLMQYDPATATPEEREIYNNMSGGILGAWTQGGVVNTAQVALGTGRELAFNHAVMNNIYSEKLSTDTDIEKGKRYSKLVRNGRYQAVKDKLDRYKEANEQLTQQGFDENGTIVGLPEEMINDQYKLLDNIAVINSQMNDQNSILGRQMRNVVKRNKFKGDDVDTYVSLIALHQDRARNDTKDLQDANEQVDELVKQVLQQREQTPITEGDGTVVEDKSAFIVAANKLKSLFKTKQYLQTVENLTKKQKVLSKRVQRMIDDYNKQNGTNFKSIEEVEQAAARQGIPLNDELVEAMQNQNMYQLESELSTNMAAKMITNADTAKKEVSNYNKVKKSDEKLRQDIDDAYMDSVLYRYAVDETPINNSNNVYVDRQGRTVVALRNPEGNIEKRLYDNGEIYPDEEPMPFDKEEWYDYQQQIQQEDRDLQNDIYEMNDAEDLSNKANLTEAEQKRLDGYISKYTMDKLQSVEKAKRDQERRRQLQETAPWFEDIEDAVEEPQHISTPTTVTHLTGPWEFEERARQEAEDRQRREKLAQDLERQRQVEIRVVNFNEGRKGNMKIPLNTARMIEDLLGKGYTVQKQGEKYVITNGEKNTKISKTAYEYANSYFIDNTNEEQYDDQHDTPKVTENQQNTLNTISRFKVTDQSPVRNDLRTGQDYFIENPDGTIRRVSRVHTVLPEMFAHHYNSDIATELIKLRNEGDVNKLNAAIRKYEKMYNDIVDQMFEDQDMRDRYHINMTGYTDYTNLIEDTEGFDHVLRIFDNIVDDKTVKVPSASVISGSIIDDLSRQLFAGIDVKYDPSFKMSEETFDKFKQDVLSKRREYENAGYVIITDPYCWYTDAVAGETDMLLIDRDGGIHVVDFKTSRFGSFAESTTYKGFVPALDDKSPSANITSREQYERQLNLYAQMIQQLTTIPVKDIRLLGFYTRLKLSNNNKELDRIRSIDSPVEIPLMEISGLLSTTIDEKDKKSKEAATTKEYVGNIDSWVADTNGIRNRLDQIYDETDNAQIRADIEKARRIFNAQMQNKDMLRPYFANAAQDIYNKLNQLSDFYKQILDNYEAVKSQKTDSDKKDVKVEQKPAIKPIPESSEIDRYNRTFIAPNKKDSPAVARFQKLSANPDFLQNTTFYVNAVAYKRKSNGYISFEKIVYKDKDGKEHVWEGNDVVGIQIKLASVDENGKPYLSPGRDNPIAQKLLQIIQDNENNLNNIKIVLTGLSRTNGVFVKDNSQRDVSNVLNYTKDDKNALFDGSNGDQIGVVGLDNSIRAITNKSVVGNNEMLFINVSALTNSWKKLTPGTIAIVHDLGYTEDTPSNRHKVPVFLESKRISQESADLIIQCLQSAPNKYPTINGVVSPLTNKQILQILVRFGAGAENTNSAFIFRYAHQGQEINSENPGDTSKYDYNKVYLKLGNTEYMFSLDNDADLKNLKDILTSKLNLYANNVKLMQSKLSVDNTTEATNPFTVIAAYFRDHENVQELRFSDDLVFSRDDIGKFGYHWMMDHGWLTTDYAGVTNPIISATDVQIEKGPDNPQPSQPTNDENPITPEGTTDLESLDIDDLLTDANNLYTTEGTENDVLGDMGLGHRIDRSKKITPIRKEKAKQTFKRMLGDSMPVEWVSTLMDIISDPDVVGMCKASSILIMEAAESGTDYHESFHAVLELLMDKKDREAIYNHYRKSYGNRSEKEIAEDLADKFFAYSKYTFHPTNTIGKFFAKMWSWIRAMYITRDSMLTRLFVSADWGKYADRVISVERMDEFKRRFGDALYMKVSTNDGNTISLKHFYTSTQLDDAINTLLYQIVKAEGLNSIGSNAQNLDLNESYIKNLKKDESGKYVSKFGKMYATLTLPGLTEDQLKDLVEQGKFSNLAMRNTLMFRELFNNYKFTQEQLFNKLQAMGIITTAEKQDADRVNIDGGEGNVVSNDIQGHSDEFYTHSRSEDVTSQIKFFLSTRPALRYATQEDINNGIVKSIYKLGKDGKPLTDRNGNKIRATVPMKTNSLGMAQFLDFKSVHQRLLTALSGVNSVDDLYEKLMQLGQNEYLFANIASSLYSMRWQSYIRYTKSGKYDNIPVVTYKGKRLSPDMYVTDVTKLTKNDLYPKVVRAAKDIKDKEGKVVIKAGDVIPGAVVAINPDMEALTTQLFQSIKSQHLNFNFTYVRPYTDSEGNTVPGKYIYEYRQTNSDQSQRQYPISWFDNIRSGYSGLFNSGKQVSINQNFNNFENAKQILGTIYNQLSNSIIKIDGKAYDITKAEDADSIYTMFVQAMNGIGIDINKQSLLYTLQDYDLSATDLWPAFKTLLVRGDGNASGGISTLIRKGGLLDIMQDAVKYNRVNMFMQDTPRVRNRDTDTTSGAYLYSTNGFIQLLASQYGKYRQRNVELMTLGAENTKQYTFAQNHTMSDMTDDLNNSYDESGNLIKGSVLDDMSKVEYVISPDHSEGSVIAKQLLNPTFNPQHNKIELHTSSGVKISNKREGGTKYIQSNAREDYLSKTQMLQQGDIILPTLSDKSTYISIAGFKLPGFDWATSQIGAMPYINARTGELAFTTNDSANGYEFNPILDQFIEYFNRELANVQKTINDLGLYGEKNTATPISKHDQIKNYHTENINGARFFSLMGIYDDSGKYIPFNVYEDTKDKGVIKGYERAMKYFFNQPKEIQRKLVARILQHRLNEELDFLVQNGIISINKRPSTDPHQYFKYENVYFDQNSIDRLYQKYLDMGFANKYGASACKSMAVVAMTFDTMCKSIMSVEEDRRFFTGMPQFFKTQYTDGVLTEYGVDETKRYGGLGSTGENNRADLPNIPDEYICAEIKDWEIGSSISETLSEAFKETEYREAYAQYLISTGMSNDAAYDKAYNQDNLEDIEKTLGEVGLKTIIDKKIKAESDSYRKKINVADGTAYISDRMAENLLRMRGAYTKDVQAAFERLRGDRGYLNSVEDYKTIFNALIGTQKYSAFGYRMQNGIPVHFYNKFALFPIFKGIAYGFTRNLYNKMVEGNVDMVMFDSAVKAGSQDAQTFNPDMSVDEVSAFTFNGHTYKQKYNFIRRQLNTDPRTEEEMAAGTQAIKIALSTIRSGQKYTIPVEEDGQIVTKEVSGEEYVDTMMQEINKLAEFGRDQVIDEFYTNGELDLVKFSNFAIRELLSRNADKNILDALRCDYSTDSNGNVIQSSIRFPININAVSNLSWLETIINSVINKNVIDIKFKGNAYYQRSVFGMDSPMVVINDENMSPELNGGKPLQLINEEGSMDAVISIDYFKDIIPPKIFNNFNKAKQWLIDNDIISGVKTGTNEWHNATAQTMGYRIPTQALASISALRFVDVIPVVRDTIILPREFTKVTGSDFDIDKLILSTLYYERTEDGVTTVNLSDPRKNTANNLLRQYLALLKDKRYAHLKYRSIDNDTELIKDVLSEIRGAVTKQTEPYQYEVLSNQVNTMQQFATGKTGIGPFALHNNNHILTQIYGVSFAESDNSILTAFDKSRLDRIIDDNGNLILSWISAFINSHVDIAKDPYITALNINAATYDLTALLIRTGFGADALYFLNNPIIRDLAEIELQQSGNIVDNPQISKFRRIQNATRDYIKNTFDDSGLNSYFKDKEEGKTKSQRMSFPLIVQIFKSGVLKDMVVNKNARIDPNGPLTVSNMSREKIYNIDGVKYSPFELQAQLFLAKEAFDKYANSLNQLVQTTKIDTKKQGNTVQQQKEYAARYLDLLGNRYFDTNSLLRMMNSSFIDLKTRLGTNMLGDILSQISITATQTFRSTVNSICDYIGDSRPATKDRVSNAVTAYIKQICMNKALEKHGFTSQEWRDMIVGNKTLASRIEGLKRWLMTDKSGKYSALVSNGMIINPLLDNLRRVPYIPQFGTEHYDLVTLDNTSDDSQDNSNNYIDAWEQLLDFTVTDENGELTPACKAIRKLANDLAIYAFMTSADTRGFTKFFKYVPISWRKSIGYSDEMESAFNDFSNGNVYVVDDASGKHDGFLIDIDEFFLNFAYDDTIVPYTDRYTRGYNGNVYNRFSGTSKNFDILNQNGEIVSSSEYALIFPTGMDFRMNEDTGEFPLYIKLQRSGTNRNSADRFLLYRCVGTYLKGVNNMQPVYGLVTPKGVSIRVGAQTYQFYSIGREDQYKHIYDKAGKKMTSQQYDKWLVNTIEQITKSVPEGYIIEDLIKYPTWQRFIQSKFLNPTGVEAKDLVTVTPYSQYIEENNPETVQDSATQDELEEAKRIKEHCKPKGGKS